MKFYSTLFYLYFVYMTIQIGLKCNNFADEIKIQV